MSLLENIDKDKIPAHVAIIMDGNGRWAVQNDKERICGHQKGVLSVRTVTETAARLGIKYLTLYAFSTENWERPEDEVVALMNLMAETLTKDTKTLIDNNIKLDVIGDIDRLDVNLRNRIFESINLTSSMTGTNLIVALSYSSRWEILEAVKKIASEVDRGKVKPEDITQEFFEKFLCTRGIPDPDLMIRTSGEYRISNFLLWQLAYTELYFVDKLWPDFGKEDFYAAIIDFQKRQRRFGKRM